MFDLDLISVLDEANIYSSFFKILFAVLCGGIIGIERGKHGSQAGLRTHILVCIGSTLSSLVGLYGYSQFGGDPFRVAAQVVSGVGFLGAGMIIVKSNNVVTGLTTAAGMWTTALIGISLGYGFYFIAGFATLACVFTAAFLTRFNLNKKDSHKIYLELDLTKNTSDIGEIVREKFDEEALLEVVGAKSNLPNVVGLYILISKRKNQMIYEILKFLDSTEGVILVIEE